MTIQGQLLDISRSRLNELHDRSWTGSRVDGLDGTTLCMGCKQLSSEGNRERAPYRSIRGEDYTGEVVPFGEEFVWAEIIQRMEPN